MKVYLLVFYVPEDYSEKVKKAVFTAGAGSMGNYDSCCWQTVGDGQFRPVSGSSPFIGSQGEVEHVREVRVEMICRIEKIDSVLEALHQAHPYETPACVWWEVDA